MKKIIFIIIGFIIVLGAVIILTIPKAKADDTVNIGYFNETIAELNERLDNQQDQINKQEEIINSLINTIENKQVQINNTKNKIDSQSKEIATIKNSIVETNKNVKLRLDDLDYRLKRLPPVRIH